ncbi:MAG: hypothetical protein LBK67_02885 [Coriobacteriales bacterium]|jgi:hypothetical protein|nr:hypothetical protein [Coriobacteriales bacterium]
MMKSRNLLRNTAVALCLALGLLFGMASMSAYGLEVPRDVQEVHIPVTLPADTPIAGGEVEFSQSTGLTYLRFEPAGGIHNPVRATVEDKTYVGFFSADNEYQPTAGNLLMGDLVFRYTGDAAEQVTLSKMKLHTKVSSDSGVSVDTEIVNPGTVIPVSRLNDSGSGGGGNGDPGDTGGSGGNGGSSNTGGSANAGTGNTGGTGGTGTGTGGTVGSGGTVVDATNTPSGSSGANNATNSSGSQGAGTDGGATGIEDSTTPLAGPIAADLDEQTLPLWLIWFLAAFIFIMLTLFLLFWFKRRQREAQTAEENFGTHMRGTGDTDHSDDKPSI